MLLLLFFSAWRQVTTTTNNIFVHLADVCRCFFFCFYFILVGMHEHLNIGKLHSDFMLWHHRGKKMYTNWWSQIHSHAHTHTHSGWQTDRHDVWCLSTLILLDLFSTQSPIDEGDDRPALMTIRNVCLPVRQTNRANIQQLYNACAIFDEAAEVEEEVKLY